MLTHVGIHPYTVRRRRASFPGFKPFVLGVAPALLFSMVLVIAFAYGLRSIDRHFSKPGQAESSESRRPEAPVLTLTA